MAWPTATYGATAFNAWLYESESGTGDRAIGVWWVANNQILMSNPQISGLDKSEMLAGLGAAAISGISTCQIAADDGTKEDCHLAGELWPADDGSTSIDDLGDITASGGPFKCAEYGVKLAATGTSRQREIRGYVTPATGKQRILQGRVPKDEGTGTERRDSSLHIWVDMGDKTRYFALCDAVSGNDGTGTVTSVSSGSAAPAEGATSPYKTIAAAISGMVAAGGVAALNNGVIRLKNGTYEAPSASHQNAQFLNIIPSSTATAQGVVWRNTTRAVTNVKFLRVWCDPVVKQIAISGENASTDRQPFRRTLKNTACLWLDGVEYINVSTSRAQFPYYDNQGAAIPPSANRAELYVTNIHAANVEDVIYTGGNHNGHRTQLIARFKAEVGNQDIMKGQAVIRDLDLPDWNWTKVTDDQHGDFTQMMGGSGGANSYAWPNSILMRIKMPRYYQPQSFRFAHNSMCVCNMIARINRPGDDPIIGLSGGELLSTKNEDFPTNTVPQNAMVLHYTSSDHYWQMPVSWASLGGNVLFQGCAMAYANIWSGFNMKDCQFAEKKSQPHSRGDSVSDDTMVGFPDFDDNTFVPKPGGNLIDRVDQTPKTTPLDIDGLVRAWPTAIGAHSAIAEHSGTDTTGPFLSGTPTVDGATLVANFSDSSSPISPASNADGFTIRVNNVIRGPTSITRTDVLQYTFTIPAVVSTDSVTIQYQPGNVVDSLGNAMSSFPITAVANITAAPPSETDPPIIQSLNITNGALTVVFSDETPPILGTTGYTVKVNGGAVEIISVTAPTGVSHLIEIAGVQSTDVVTLSYAPGNITDSASGNNPMAAFTDRAVVNDTPPPRVIFQPREFLMPNEFDLENWGGVYGTDISKATQNNEAILDALASGTHVIYLHGPVVISNTVNLVSRGITIIGNNANATSAGGFIVTGTGTAQSDSVVKLTDSGMQRVENVRFYGHASAPTTKCVSAIKGLRAAGTDLKAVGASIDHCEFKATGTAIAFNDLVVVDALAGETEGHSVLVQHCYMSGFDGYALKMLNAGASSWLMTNCHIDPGGANYAAWATAAVKSESSGTIRDCFLTNVKVGLDNACAADRTVSLRDCHVTNCRRLLDQTVMEGRTVIDGGSMSLDEAAYTGASGADLRAIDARGRQLVLRDMSFVANLGGATRPHLYLGNSTSSVKGDIEITGNTEWVLDDIDNDTTARRLGANVNGVRLTFQSASQELSEHFEASDTVVAPKVTSLRDHGAVGDGTTDDTVALQAALDSGAQAIYIPEGTYITGQVTLSADDTTVHGEGVLKLKNSTVCTNAMFYVTGDRNTIRGLTFRGNPSSPPASDFGIPFSCNGDFNVIDRCKFYDSTCSGTDSNQINCEIRGDNNIVQNCQSYAADYSNYTNRGDYNKFVNNVSRVSGGNTRKGMNASGGVSAPANYMLIDGLDADQIVQIDWASENSGTLIENAVVRNVYCLSPDVGGDAAKFGHIRHLEISDCYFENNTDGIGLIFGESLYFVTCVRSKFNSGTSQSHVRSFPAGTRHLSINRLVFEQCQIGITGRDPSAASVSTACRTHALQTVFRDCTFNSYTATGIICWPEDADGVESQGETTPPTLGAPDAGKNYIIGAGATGAWSGKDFQVVLWNGTAWANFEVPTFGTVIYDKNLSDWYRYVDGTTNWEVLPVNERHLHIENCHFYGYNNGSNVTMVSSGDGAPFSRSDQFSSFGNKIENLGSSGTQPTGLSSIVPIMQMWAPKTWYGTAAPTVGTWVTGDRVFDSTPGSEAQMGWVCTAGGTPGTWTAMPDIP